MQSKREQAFVGLFVLIAAGVFLPTGFGIRGPVVRPRGAFGPSTKTYHTFFPFAGGLESGAQVRYSGGPKVGRVEHLRIDPQNPARIEIIFSVQSELPVKT